MAGMIRGEQGVLAALTDMPSRVYQVASLSTQLPRGQPGPEPGPQSLVPRAVQSCDFGSWVSEVQCSLRLSHQRCLCHCGRQTPGVK